MRQLYVIHIVLGWLAQFSYIHWSLLCILHIFSELVTFVLVFEKVFSIITRILDYLKVKTYLCDWLACGCLWVACGYIINFITLIAISHCHNDILCFYPGQWLVPCEKCSDERSCDWDKARWQPHDCRYREISQSEARQCLAGKKVGINLI